MFYMILGIFIGFLVSFLVLKRSIVKSGYGQLKVCKETCPYYKQVEGDEEDD